MPFRPTDFTQVNPHINRVLVDRAIRLLNPQRGERVIDWFCGLGNFTLPLATRAGEVLGIEGSEALVARSRENYERNQSARPAGDALAPARFEARNLFEMSPEQLVADGIAERWLVDPPREGAFALAKAVADLHQDPSLRKGWRPPRRIVVRELQPGDAGARCRPAGAPGRLRLHRGRGGEHVPAHGARGVHRGVRAAMKNGAPGPVFLWAGSAAQSSPAVRPSSASRLWNTLNRSRYSARVAVM
jgi:hypothetical protein